VPLTVFASRSGYVLLDGERRWRCALKLGLTKVPVIVQPEPDKMTNIMMMFAIHNKRRDWDPLPTALKLQELENLFQKQQGRKPRESELAELASLSVGEVRRYKRLLQLPQEYRDELMRELEKPRADQKITVDHVLEASKAAELLRKRGIIDPSEEDSLRKALIDKYRSGVIKNTVEPRKLVRMSQAVERGEINAETAREVVENLVKKDAFGIERAYAETIAPVELQHTTNQLVERATLRMKELLRDRIRLSKELQKSLIELRDVIDELIKK
jgi:ParB/RepB/Spo0J family partition protein